MAGLQSSITGQTSEKYQNITYEGLHQNTGSIPDRDNAVRLMLKLFSGSSGGPVNSTILPLTIDGTEILLKALKEGDGEEVLVTLPHRSGYLSFIRIAILECVKIMQAFGEEEAGGGH